MKRRVTIVYNPSHPHPAHHPPHQHHKPSTDGGCCANGAAPECSQAQRQSVPEQGWCMYLAVGLIAALCYLNGIQGDFVHDDIPAITLNKDVLGHGPVAQVFRNDFWGTPMADLSSHKSYRPLTTLTFR
uniref:Transmembrane and TPR repeat-containing protein 3 n=1 Tax=Anopheles stephensi TaxID=30069 RepID=A0A182YIZ4_ANOST